MFQHVTVLVSFIFAIALTHVFSSASQLLLARDRARFSELLTESMVNAVGARKRWIQWVAGLSLLAMVIGYTIAFYATLS